MKRSTKGRAAFYTRDSGGKHEMTPGKYVAWASDEARKRGLTFNGTPSQIDAMIRDGRPALGDIFLDFDVKGNNLTRPGLDALKAEIKRDSTISHLFIPRRDRLARPDDPLDGMRLEAEFRMVGITVVFMDRVGLPIAVGERQDIADLIVSLIDYDNAGVFRRDLARKVIIAQIALAQLGFSTGGRAPYGFRRWLVKADGTPVRELADGEHVRMAGHHVVWLPGPEKELRLIRRICHMLKTTPATRVAATLNKERIPSPGAGTYRTENGVKHKVIGLWYQTTISNIARNRLLLAVSTYGLRSLGDQLRMTPSGPRPLSDGDYQADKKPKVIRNPESQRISAPSASAFAPIVDPETFEELQVILDQRAGTQRGKSRSRDPSKNPLGCRVFDWNCTWPMYRIPHGKSYRYRCSVYEKTDGQECAHNWIDGPLATNLALSCVSQRLHSPSLLAKLKARVRQLAEEERRDGKNENETAGKRTALSKVSDELELAARNLRRAESDDQYREIASDYEQLKKIKAAIEAELATLEAAMSSATDIDAEIDAAVDLARRLGELADAKTLAMATEAVQLANARLCVRFAPVKLKKRFVNRVTGGVVLLGAAPLPFTPYEVLTTSRSEIKKETLGGAAAATGPGGRRSSSQPKPKSSGGKGTSLGNVNRGDRI
jgi:hypothetical protein